MFCGVRRIVGHCSQLHTLQWAPNLCIHRSNHTASYFLGPVIYRFKFILFFVLFTKLEQMICLSMQCASIKISIVSYVSHSLLLIKLGIGCQFKPPAQPDKMSLQLFITFKYHSMHAYPSLNTKSLFDALCYVRHLTIMICEVRSMRLLLTSIPEARLHNSCVCPLAVDWTFCI